MITVTDNRIPKPVIFCKIGVGDTFLVAGTLYMRTERGVFNSSNTNAICLCSGQHFLFDNIKDVTEVDVEILITNRK